MSVNDQGAIIAGNYGPGNIPSELLKYDKDRAGALLYIQRGTTKFMSMMHKRFGKRDVRSFLPKWWEIGELDHRFKVLETQTAATYKKIKLTNDQAMQLQTGDLLSVDSLFMADGYAGGTAGSYSKTYSLQHRLEEQILVTAEPIPDSAGTGYAYVSIRRGYSNDNTTGRIMAEPAGTTNNILMAENTYLSHMGNLQFTGSDAPHGKTKNITVDSNPLQIMRFAFEEQVETELEETFLKEKPMDINMKLALRQMAYQFEYRAFFNRPVVEQQDNRWRYAMGGMFDFIKNVVDYSVGGTVNTMRWMDFQKNAMAPIFDLGGSSSKVAFSSIEQFTNLATMLWDKVTITVNERWSKEFEFEIYKIAGGGGELNVVPSWVYGQNKFRKNQMMIVDFGGPYFKVDVLEDLHINKGPGGAGLQLPGQRIKKFEYVMIGGLQRRAAQYHTILSGLPSL